MKIGQKHNVLFETETGKILNNENRIYYGHCGSILYCLVCTKWKAKRKQDVNVQNLLECSVWIMRSGISDVGMDTCKEGNIYNAKSAQAVSINVHYKH